MLGSPAYGQWKAAIGARLASAEGMPPGQPPYLYLAGLVVDRSFPLVDDIGDPCMQESAQGYAEIVGDVNPSAAYITAAWGGWVDLVEATECLRQ